MKNISYGLNGSWKEMMSDFFWRILCIVNHRDPFENRCCLIIISSSYFILSSVWGTFDVMIALYTFAHSLTVMSNAVAWFINSNECRYYFRFHQLFPVEFSLYFCWQEKSSILNQGCLIRFFSIKYILNCVMLITFNLFQDLESVHKICSAIDKNIKLPYESVKTRLPLNSKTQFTK